MHINSYSPRFISILVVIILVCAAQVNADVKNAQLDPTVNIDKPAVIFADPDYDPRYKCKGQGKDCIEEEVKVENQANESHGASKWNGDCFTSITYTREKDANGKDKFIKKEPWEGIPFEFFEKYFSEKSYPIKDLSGYCDSRIVSRTIPQFWSHRLIRFKSQKLILPNANKSYREMTSEELETIEKYLLSKEISAINHKPQSIRTLHINGKRIEKVYPEQRPLKPSEFLGLVREEKREPHGSFDLQRDFSWVLYHKPSGTEFFVYGSKPAGFTVKSTYSW